MPIGRWRRPDHAAPQRLRRRATLRARGRRTALAAAVPLGLVASTSLVWHSSHAAFVGTTDSPGNSWGTGVVQLSSDRGGTALFTTASEGPLVPGSSGSRCITVTYTGNVDTADSGVRLHGALTAGSSPELAAALQVTVEMSTTALVPAPDADCAGFEAAPLRYATTALGAFPTGHATGIGDVDGDTVGDWRPTATAERSRTYRISYSLPADSHPTSIQGKQVEMTFTWEVRSDDTPA
ncbi:hypothetical protein SAMN06893096_106169 [Geodermatophilus pulveris]|uniref:SipW-cognate class signal peptide n=1 Tax=Geodermatophilus pulveris TaxID=1564159 RepID=A0A239GGA4_9ACTN|nr:hypothetical protein [Geodermatophilus pulveris]SNS67768.1 hypothetical protein SAMN06893096_106169 [Geodermatophilus pulveris]